MADAQDLKSCSLRRVWVRVPPSLISDDSEAMNLQLLIREVRDFFRFYFQLQPLQKRLVFYSEHKGYFQYFEPLLKSIAAQKNIGIVYISSDEKDPGLGLSSDYDVICPIYSKILLPILFLFLDCQVAVLTVPGLNQSILHRSTNETRYVYVFHSLVSTTLAYKDNAFDHYDAIFAVGPHQITEIRERERLRNLKEKLLVPYGYPRLEQLIGKFKAQTPRISPAPRVLIAPSFNANNFLEKFGTKIIRPLLEAGFNVRVRLHPETARRNPPIIKMLEKEAGQNAALILDRLSNSDDAIFNSDILISDVSGIALSFAFTTERPVLFIEEPLPDRKEAAYALELTIRNDIGRVLKQEQISDVASHVQSLLNAAKEFSGKISDARKKFIFNLGGSEKIGADALNQLLSQPYEK